MNHNVSAGIGTTGMRCRNLCGCWISNAQRSMKRAVIVVGNDAIASFGNAVVARPFLWPQSTASQRYVVLAEDHAGAQQIHCVRTLMNQNLVGRK